MFKKISLTTILTLLTCLLFGCSDEIFNFSADDSDEEPEGFRICVPHVDFTRATSTPTDGECYISSLTLVGFYVDDNGNETGKAEIYQISDPATYDNKIAIKKNGVDYDSYEIKAFPNGKFHFYIIANAPDIAKWGKTQVENQVYNSSDKLKKYTMTYTEKMLTYPQMGSNYKGIPMTCEHSYMKDSEGNALPAAYEVKGGGSIYADFEFCLAKVTVTVEKANGEYEELSKALLYNFADGFPLSSSAVLERMDATEQEVHGWVREKNNSEKPLTPNAKVNATDEDNNTYTFYVPETKYAGQPNLKVTFNGKDVTIPLGEENKTTGEYDVERGHHYAYTLLTKGDIKLDVYKWSPEALTAEINAPFELILYIPNSYIDAKLSSNEKYKFKYYSDAENVSIVSPKFSWTDANNKSQEVSFYDYSKSGDEISIWVNNKVPLAKYQALSDQEKNKYLYFHVRANNLMKRVDVKEVGVDPSFSVNPRTVIIDLREQIGLGNESFTQQIDYACNFGNVVADWSTAKWTNTTDGTGDPLADNVVSQAVSVINTTAAAGVDEVTFSGLDQGITFYEKRRYLSVTYKVTANAGEEAWLQKLKDKGQDKITVKFTVIPFSSNYKIHFKSEQAGWNSPHIYVYQCLELPSDLEGANKDYRGKTVGGSADNAALQYCFSSGFCFKGWKGYGGPDVNDPNASGSRKAANNGFFIFDGANPNYLPNGNGDVGGSVLNTTRYMWYNFNAAHYENLISSGQYSSKCSETNSSKRDQCNTTWNPAPDNNTNWARLWPGVIMEEEEEGWWTYELSGVAEPGKTLIMFSNGHGGDDSKRFPGSNEVGVPLFDYEDKEGWFVYTGKRTSDDKTDYSVNRFYDEKEDIPDPNEGKTKYRLYWPEEFGSFTGINLYWGDSKGSIAIDVYTSNKFKKEDGFYYYDLGVWPDGASGIQVQQYNGGASYGKTNWINEADFGFDAEGEANVKYCIMETWPSGNGNDHIPCSQFKPGIVEIPGDYNIAYTGTREKIHYWGGDSSSTYPGVTMGTAKGSDGKTYKVYRVANNTEQILFATNGNSDKTSDYAYVEGYVYNDGGKTSKKVIFVSSSNAKKRLNNSKKRIKPSYR